MESFVFVVVEDVDDLAAHQRQFNDIVLTVRRVEHGKFEARGVDAVVAREEEGVHVDLQCVVVIGGVADVAYGFEAVAMKTVFAEFDAGFGVDEFFASFPVEDGYLAVVDADEVEGARHLEFFVEDGPFRADGFEVIVAGEVEEEIPFGCVVSNVFALVESFDTTVEGCAQLARFISFLTPFLDKAFGRDAHFSGFFGGDFFHFEV